MVKVIDWIRSKKKWILKLMSVMQRQWAIGTILLWCLLAVSIITVKCFPVNGNTYCISIDYITLGGILALFFPILAVSFILSSINVRFDEIVERFTQDKLWVVYAGTPNEDDEYRFTRFLRRRINDYYDLKEFILFSLLAGAFTFIIFLIITNQLVVDRSTALTNGRLIDLQGPEWALLAGAGFLGSLSGTVVFVLRRYRTYNLQPIVFLQTIVAILAGTFTGAFVTITYIDKLTGFNISIALAFVIGFLGAINIDFLSKLMRSTFAKLTHSTPPPEIKSDLPNVVKNNDAIESLNSIAISSIRELANADPVRLYLNIPQQIEMINTMVDQAILHFYFSTIISDLEQVNMQRFTQLLMEVSPQFSVNTITWPATVSIIDGGGAKDMAILKAVKGIVDGRLHHRFLGLLNEKYRNVFFEQ